MSLTNTASAPLTEPVIVYADKALRQLSPEYFLGADINNHVTVDLSLTEFMDTASLNALLKAQQILEAQHYTLMLVNPQAPIRTLLYATQTYHRIPSFSQHLQAMQFIQQESAPQATPQQRQGAPS